MGYEEREYKVDTLQLRNIFVNASRVFNYTKSKKNTDRRKKNRMDPVRISLLGVRELVTGLPMQPPAYEPAGYVDGHEGPENTRDDNSCQENSETLPQGQDRQRLSAGGVGSAIGSVRSHED